MATSAVSKSRVRWLRTLRCCCWTNHFAGLDSGEIADLAATIRQVHADEGLTVLLIEHKLREFMQLVDRVIALDFGAKIGEGSPEDIVRQLAVIDAYLGRGDETEVESDRAA